MNFGPSVVYIVDDDPSLRRALERLAQSLGLDARSFANRAEFLAGDHDDRPVSPLW